LSTTNPTRLTWVRIWAAMVKIQWLATWAMAQPPHLLNFISNFTVVMSSVTGKTADNSAALMVYIHLCKNVLLQIGEHVTFLKHLHMIIQFILLRLQHCQPGSSVSIVSWLRAARPGDWGSIPGKGKRIFPVASVSRLALGSTQPPVQWIPKVLSPRVKCSQGVTLATHPHLVPRSRMSRSYTSSPHKRLQGM
jgi:hypothetical protein